jgi:surface-anchored protein
VFDSGKTLPQDSGVEANTHVHGNWVFGAAGAYRIDLEMTATGRSGEQLSGRATLRVFVGAGDPASAFPAAPGTPASGSAPASGPVPDPAAAAGSTVDRPWLWPVLGGAVLAGLIGLAAVRRARRAGR